MANCEGLKLNTRTVGRDVESPLEREKSLEKKKKDKGRRKSSNELTNFSSALIISSGFKSQVQKFRVIAVLCSHFSIFFKY